MKEESDLWGILEKTYKMIDITKKTESISWDEIGRVVWRAHAQNRERGVDIRNAHLSGEEIKNSIGHDGDCFVAIDTSSGNVVACCSSRYNYLDTWWAQGKYAYATLDAVLPDYSGKHIFSRLSEARLEAINEKKCSGIYMYVAERNKLRRKIARKEGYIPVELRMSSYNPHYYLVYVKWLMDKPHSSVYLSLRFIINWIYVRIRNSVSI